MSGKRTKHVAIVRIVILTLTALFLTAAFIDAASTGSANLLLELPGQGRSCGSPDPAVVIRQRCAAVNGALFAGGAPPTIELNLFPDVHFTAVLLRTEAGAAGATAWIGKIVDQPDSRVIVVIENGRASGLVRVGDRRFDLRSLDREQHAVQEIDVDKLGPATAVLSRQIPEARGDIQGTEERAVFDLVNQERSKSGLTLLSPDDRLTTAARAHSQDMADQNYFDHESLDGRSPGDRITAAGYEWNAYGENIAFGFTTPETVMQAWMNSPGHKANILDDAFCDLGVGYVAEGNYWTQDFGRLRGVTACPAPSGETGGGGTSSDPVDAPAASSSGSSGGGGGCFIGSVTISFIF